jgi:hypothetical protein
MEKDTLILGIAKLVMAGQQAGFTVEQMIELLNAGVGLDTLIDLISWHLEQPSPLTPVIRSSGWIA